MSPLFKESNIRKLPNKIGLKICLFINISTNLHPQSLKKLPNFSADSHAYNTCWSDLGCVVPITHNTRLYGRNSLLVVSTHGIIYKNQMNV